MTTKPTYGVPSMTPEYDEEGEPIRGTLTAGWDVSFGCRVNFGPDPDGNLRVHVSVSDAAKRDGVASRTTTPTALRSLAGYLFQVADEQDRLANPSCIRCGCEVGPVWAGSDEYQASGFCGPCLHDH